MTATETRTEADPSEAAPTATSAVPARGLAAVLGSGDHKVIGRLWIGFSLLFALVALVVGALLGLENGDLGSSGILGSDAFQVFTLYRVAAVFLVGLPLFIGIATYVVPLQVGARSIALPRAAAAAFWTWLVGAGTVLAGYAIDGGPGGGRSDGVELWMVALGVVLVALVAASVCIATTVIALRTPGMTMSRVPLFAWSMLVAASLWILTLPVLAANLLLAYLDHRYGQQLFGVDADIWAQVMWVFEQPQIYTVAIPALGIIGEVMPVAGGGRPRSRNVAMASIGLFGLLGFGAWSQPFFNSGSRDEVLFVAVAVLIVFPLLALFGAIGPTGDDTRDRPRVNAAFVYAVSAVLVLLGATTAGIIGAIEPFSLAGTSFVTGQMNLVLLGALLAGLGGLWYWGPKIWGVRLSEGLGHLSALLVLVGALVAGVVDLVSGSLDQPQVLTADYAARDGVEALNLGSGAGLGLVLVGVLVAAVAVVSAARSGSRAAEGDRPADPWGGQTLEWSVSSPPPWDNFADDPATVTSASPLLDLAEEGA